LVDVIVSVTTNKTPEQIQSIFDEKTDAGQRTHYAVSSTGNAIMTVMAGATIIKDLPEIAEKLAENIKKAKKVFSSMQEMVEKVVKNRGALRESILDLSETKTLAREYAKHIGVPDNEFDNWFENTFKTYEGGTPNFEAHHVIPVEVLQTNERFQQLLFDLQKADPNFNFDFNGIDNGMMLQKKSVNLDINTGHANHPQYNDAINKKINEILSTAKNDNDAFNKIQNFINDTKNKLTNEVLLGNKDVNNIIDL
jgi:DNA repair ATPase RecN